MKRKLSSSRAWKEGLGDFLPRFFVMMTLAFVLNSEAALDPFTKARSGPSFASSAAVLGAPSGTSGGPLAIPGRGGQNVAGHPLKDLGWSEIPNTQLASVCPDIADIHGTVGCSAVISAWAGGLADTKRNRLVLWGGGHSDYFGNEWYALDLTKMAIERLTEPSTGQSISNLRDCPEAFSDGKPNSRHTYNGLQYLPKQDLYFLLGGGLSPCGSFSNTVWMFNPATLTWTRTNPKTHPTPAQNGSVPMTASDPVTGMVYEVESNTGYFWQYNPLADSWKNFGEVSGCSKLNMTAAIDPLRKLYYCIGNGSFSKISLTRSHSAKPLRGAGCENLISVNAPGFDFDSSQNRMVGWGGGDTIYVYDVENDSCRSQDFLGGPGKEQTTGTYGRFRYFPDLHVFALINDWKHNGYLLRLSSPGSP